MKLLVSAEGCELDGVRAVALIFRAGGFGPGDWGSSMAGHRSSIERECNEPPKMSEFRIVSSFT